MAKSDYDLTMNISPYENKMSFTRQHERQVSFYILPCSMIQEHLSLVRQNNVLYTWQFERVLTGLSSKCKNANANLSRVRNRIFEIVANNQFTHFITLTFDIKKIDRNNADLVSKKLRKALNNYKQKVDKHFTYLLVPEKHEKGQVHFHGFFNLSKENKDIEYLGIDKKSKHEVFRSRWLFNSFGANRLVAFPQSDKLFISKYATKYITKEVLTKKVLNRSYYVSLGLKQNQVIKIKDLSIDEVKMIHKLLINFKMYHHENGFNAYLSKTLENRGQYEAFFSALQLLFRNTFYTTREFDTFEGFFMVNRQFAYNVNFDENDI